MRRAAGHQTQRHYDAVRKRSLAPSHEFDQRGSRVQELLKWIGALAMLTGFALTMGGNPALYAATADMLARKTRWLPRIIWMTAGLALGSTVLFAIFQFVNPNSFVHAVRGRVDDLLLNIWVDLVAGVVFLLAAAGIAAWRILRPTLPVRAPSEPKPDAKPYSYFVISVSSSIIGFTTLPVMYLTGRVLRVGADRVLQMMEQPPSEVVGRRLGQCEIVAIDAVDFEPLGHGTPRVRDGAT